MFFKSLKGQWKIEELKHTLSKAKLNNEKIASKGDQLKYDLNAQNEETACLAKDLVTKKRSNTSKDSKITKLSQKLEKVKFDVDQHIRLEKRRLKADVIQTCMGLFQEKHSDIEFQWMLIAYVSRKNQKEILKYEIRRQP